MPFLNRRTAGASSSPVPVLASCGAAGSTSWPDGPSSAHCAYASLYLDEEVRLEGWARSAGAFARFLEVISFSHAVTVKWWRTSKGPPAVAARCPYFENQPYGAINATWLLMASNVFFASSWVAFTWPYQALPPAFDWSAA
jgi:hypothetical protein